MTTLNEVFAEMDRKQAEINARPKRKCLGCGVQYKNVSAWDEPPSVYDYCHECHMRRFFP